MCLVKVFTDSEMAEWLEDQPEVIEVWKVAFDFGKRFIAPCEIGAYENSLNIAIPKKVQSDYLKEYWSGFHFLISANDVREIICEAKFASKCDRAIKCLIKKEWITAMGTSYYFAPKGKIVIVASQAVFPHYPETEARLEDLPKEITHHSSEARFCY